MLQYCNIVLLQLYADPAYQVSAYEYLDLIINMMSLNQIRMRFHVYLGCFQD